MKILLQRDAATPRHRPIGSVAAILWLLELGTAQAFVFSLAAEAPPPVGTVVANYRADFRADTPLATGWRYLWNAPTGWVANASSGDMRSGFIGTPSGYAALQDAGTYWSPDGDSDGINNDPAGHLKLTANGGHPGKHEGGTNTRARYAIAAYTVPSAGVYAIENSFLTKTSASGDGIEVLVFPGISGAVFRDVAAPAGTIAFDVRIGWLAAGQTIYVAIGADATTNSDGFLMDFDVVRYDGEDIQTQVLAAVARGDAWVRIAPGRYYSNVSKRHVDLNALSGLTIVADGVELVCQTPNRALELEACADVTVTGLTIDYDPPLHIQGTIEAMGSNWLNLRLHRGYPVPTVVTTSGIAYEPTGDLPMKSGCFTRYPTSMQALEPDLIRYAYPNVTDNAAVGDYFCLRASIAIPHGIGLIESAGIVLDKVRVHSSPSFGIFAQGGGRLTFNQVEVVPGEKPLLASVKRLRSSNADGIHVKGSSGDVAITGCRLEYNGDDSIVLTSPYAAVIAHPSANVVTVAFKREETYHPGERMELYEHASTQRVDRTLASMAASSLTSAEVQALTAQYFPNATFTTSKAFDLTLNSAVNAAPGDYVSNADQSNEGFEISGCSVRNTRARGILVKASDGVISNNVVVTAWLAGIQLRPEPVLWMEGDFSSDLHIVGNSLNRCGVSPNSYGSVRVDAEDPAWNAYGHQSLLFEGNTVSNAPGCSIYLRYAAQVELRNNAFYHSHEWMVSTAVWNRSVVWLDTADQILFTGSNTVHNLGGGANASALIGTGANVSNVGGTLLLED